jgi:hypothetical protein
VTKNYVARYKYFCIYQKKIKKAMREMARNAAKTPRVTLYSLRRRAVA